MGLQRLFLIPDCHVPFHDKRALRLVLKVAKEFKPDVLIHLGDLADFWSISRFSKDPKRADTFESEVAEVNTVLDQLDDIGARRKIITLGNHEQRLDRYLADKAPELAAFVDVPTLFRLKERSWKVVPYKDHVQLGKLWLSHDSGPAGRYSVYRCLENYNAPIATAHTHRLATVVEGNAKGEHMISAQFGWLGDFAQADYTHRVTSLRYWSHGFGVGYLDEKSRNVHLQALPLVGYSVVVEGKLYRG